MFGFLFSPVKFLIYFSISFLILCIPIKGDKHVFDYLEEVARPLTSKVYFFLNEKTNEGLRESKKIFTNSAPIIKDKIKSSLSSAAKKGKKIKEDVKDNLKDEKFENYTIEEREAIKKILSNEY